jgi:hypothetical protein
MKLSEAFPSKWLKAADIGDDPMTLTIASHKMAEMQDGNRKPAIYFEEDDRGLILNKTNGNTIAAAYGDDMLDWNGQRIQLISVPVDMQGKTVDAIRVRVRQAKAAAKPQQVRSGAGNYNYGELKERVQAEPKTKADALNDEIPW